MAECKAPRSPQAIQEEQKLILAEAESLHSRAQSDDDHARVDEMFAQLDNLDRELHAAKKGERFTHYRARLAEPTRPAPAMGEVQSRTREDGPTDDPLVTWAKSRFGRGKFQASEAHYRSAAAAGIDLSSNSCEFQCDYGPWLRPNEYKRRTQLSTGGSGTGAEYTYTTYAAEITRYLALQCPLASALAGESQPTGNLRTYFKIDDTALESADVSSETSPTIGNNNLVTAKVTCKPKTITSGFHRVTWEELRDSAVNLLTEVSRSIAISHARKIEDDLINASGDGDPDVQGLSQLVHSEGTVTAWSISNFRTLYGTQPLVYQPGSIFIFDPTAYYAAMSDLVDDIGRSFFNVGAADDPDYVTLLGHRVLVSRYMASNSVYYVNPEFYRVLMVSGQRFDSLPEKNYPDATLVGCMSFGGVGTGPTGASGVYHKMAHS